MVVLSESGAAVPTDESLLARHRTGDRQALEELFRRYRMAAYRVAYRLQGHEADALDAVQEGFIKAVTRLNTFQGRSAFKTWLLRVVSNAALDLGRQRARREACSLEAPQAAAWKNSRLMIQEGPSLVLERADLRQLLDQALANLPEAQRRTLVLHLDGDLNYREVAEVLGISQGTVMSRLFYARRKLQACLAGLMAPGLR